ncbi:MAG: methyltransferase domain-containing protein [Bacteroidetes bacterium]|nr:MAG: methyltransferase domain-containing protein [Bacteroidota bacterium]GIV57504.1 MAG: O-methyltransferase [Rhodothermaceae bacterium]
MSNRTLGLSDALYDYLLSCSLREPEVMRRLRAETARLPEAEMQIAPEQGQFMALLVRLMGARRALEIGTFTGYSALAVARALPEDGRLIACDVSEAYTAIARAYWKAAGVDHKIDLRLAPALQTLDALLDEGAEGTFDFAFIDADKENYPAYYERTLRLLRPGGLALIDNTLREGRVADPTDDDPIVRLMRAFNERLLRDDRIELSLLPLADGLTLALKR